MTSVQAVGERQRRVGLWAAVAPVALLASAVCATFPVRADVLGLRVDCGASLLAGQMEGEGLLHVETTLACHQAADPWRLAALGAGLVSLGAGVVTTVGLHRQKARAVSPPG